MQAMQYEARLENAVDDASTTLHEVTRLYELNMPSARNADATHPYQTKLDAAQAALKAAKARLAAFRKLDAEQMATEIAELRSSSTPDLIARAVDNLRTKLTTAAMMRLEAHVELLRLGGEFRSRIQRAQTLENQLLGTNKPTDFHKQPGFGDFKLQVSREDVLAELERLVDSDDASSLRRELKRDDRGKLLIAGLPAHEMLGRTGI